MRVTTKAVVDSYQIWNKIVSYLAPKNKQKLTMLNTDLSKRTKDYIEWELREIAGKPVR